jgi:hypothetical protein
MNVTYPPAYARKPLPSPFGQGCLWGLLQGAISALLLVLLKKDVFFYLGVVEGLFFYCLAGFFATHRGGSLARAGRAGFWAGIISTIFYWIVLPLGLLIQALPYFQDALKRAQERGVPFNSGDALKRAVGEVIPPIFAGTYAGSQRGNVLVYALIGLVCAIGFALLGGLLGQKSESR